MTTSAKRRYRIFISTGEVSGDLQGALLIEALKQRAALGKIELEILALGGERMAAAGAHLLADTSAIGSIGLFESLPHIRSTQIIQQQVKRYLSQHPPDLMVMIDYFAPNISLGRFMRRSLAQVPLVYYIAPQEWVWSVSQRNTKRILAITDRLLAIFPAEASYYQERGANVTWVGHPLIDRMQAAPTRAAARAMLDIAPDQLAVALIPASRQQELRYVLPVIFAAAQQIQTKLPQVKFWIPLSLERYRQPIQQAIQQYGLQAEIVPGKSQIVIAAADLVLAKSGTVNLETALLNVPQVVMYRVHPLTAWIAEHLLKFSAPFVSPPNLVMMQPIVPEFLQSEATPASLAQAALELLEDPQKQAEMQAGYRQMRQKLGEPGVCQRAADAILQMLYVSKPSRASVL
jgi:lipid-A-disaccharide synthase